MKYFHIFILIIFISCDSTDKNDQGSIAQEGDTLIVDTVQKQEFKEFEYTNDGEMYESYLTYHPNGNIKVKGQWQDEWGCFSETGIWECYYEGGNIQKTVKYKNWLEKPDDGCHSLQIIKNIKEFYETGELMMTYQIRTCLECSEFKIGEWIAYSKTGSVTSSTSYDGTEEILN